MQGRHVLSTGVKRNFVLTGEVLANTFDIDAGLGSSHNQGALSGIPVYFPLTLIFPLYYAPDLVKSLQKKRPLLLELRRI